MISLSDKLYGGSAGNGTRAAGKIPSRVTIIMKTKKTQFLAILALLGAAAFVPSCTLDARAPAPQITSIQPGYTMATVPPGHTVVTHRGVRYYMADGVYYRPTASGQFVAVPSPF